MGGSKLGCSRRGVAAAIGALGAALLLVVAPTAAAAATAPLTEVLPPALVGDGPFEVTTSPDGSLTYVLVYHDAGIEVIDTATNTPAHGRIDLPGAGMPLWLAVHPDGRVLVLDANNDLTFTPAIFEIDPTDWSVHRHDLALPPGGGTLGWAGGLALSPDGAKAYVSDPSNGLVLSIPVPPAAGGTWSVTPIEVESTTTPTITPGSLAAAGDYVYVADVDGEAFGGVGVAAIRIVDDVVLPNAIGIPTPPGAAPGTIQGNSVLVASADGSTVVLVGAAGAVDPLAPLSGHVWSIRGGTVPATVTHVAESPAGELYDVAVSPDGRTAYPIGCACTTVTWSVDLASGATTPLDLSDATDLDTIQAMAISPDGLRLLLTGYNPSGDSMLWQFSTIADEALAVSGPSAAEEGGSATLTVTGYDNSGNAFDLTSLAGFSSSVPTDTFSGNVVTFHHASPHTITASYTPVAGGPMVAAGSITIEVAGILPPTGSADPHPWLAAGAGLLLGGAALVLASRRHTVA